MMQNLLLKRTSSNTIDLEDDMYGEGHYQSSPCLIATTRNSRQYLGIKLENR